MENDDWRTRLTTTMARKEISARALSLSAGCGPGYVHSILKEGKDPTIERLRAVADQLDVTVSHLLYGIDVSPETAEVVQLLEDNPEKRQGILAILRQPSSGG